MAQQNPDTKSYPISFNAVYPEKMSRLTTFFRLLLVIPQYIVIGVLLWVNCIITFIAWLVIIFTGKYPKGIYDFSAGVLRWYTRFFGYIFLLTDKYPPFSMDP